MSDVAPPPTFGSPQSAPADKKDEKAKAPTILAALSESTPEERAALDAEGKPSEANTRCAAALYAIMQTAAQLHEPIYAEADEVWRFRQGQQYQYNSAALNMPSVVPEPSTKLIRGVWNYLGRGIDRQVSILLKDPPMPRCLAASGGIVDEMASEAGNTIVEWRERRSTLSAEKERVYYAAATSGFCWLLTEWDDSVGPMGKTGEQIPDPDFDETTAPPNPDGTPAVAPQIDEEIRAGDFKREVLTHRQGVWDPSATSLFGGSFFFVRRETSRFDFAKAHPDLKIEEFAPEGDEKLKRVSDLGRGLSSATQANYGSGTDKDKLEIDLLFVPSCPGYPRGRRILMTRDRIVEEKDNQRWPSKDEEKKGEQPPNPNERPWHPAFPFVHALREQTPVGESPARRAITPQKACNALGSTELMHAARAKGKWKVPDSLGTELTDETIQVVKVKARGFDHRTLEALTPPPMPDYQKPFQANKQAVYEFLGLNMNSTGQDENAGDSGYKVRLQQQVSSDDLEKVRQRHNAMWAEVLEYELFLFRRHGTVERQIDVVGPNKTIQLRELSGESILAGTRVYCINDASIPRDPQAKMLWLTQLMQSGVLNVPDPKDREKFMRLFNNHDLVAFTEAEEADRARAKRQFLKIMHDQDPGGISDWDDHLVQLDVLTKCALSEEFEKKVEDELMASAQQLAAAPPPMPMAPPMPAPAAPGAPPAQPGMPGMMPPAPPQPTSPAHDRMAALIKAHRDAVVAQQQAVQPIVKLEGDMSPDQVSKSLGEPPKGAGPPAGGGGPPA